MKKFVKLAAVFAALVLALSCFVACSNNSDSDSNSDASGLAGLWIDEDEHEEGIYLVDDKWYYAYCVDGKYYYVEDEVATFTVSGNKITRKYEDDTKQATFKINGNKLTIDNEVLEKVNKKPAKISWEKLEELLDSSGDDDDDDASVLAGLWIDYDVHEEGIYLVGDKWYPAYCVDGKYYYVENDAYKFTVSGKKITFDHGHYTVIFKISGNKLTLTYYNDYDEEFDRVVHEKVNKKPTKISAKELDELFGSGDDDDDDDVSLLEGLWIFDYDEENGIYLVGNKWYPVCCVNGKYYYVEDDEATFTVSGNKITWKYEDDTDQATFKISGNKLTLTYYDDYGEENDRITFEKVNKKPTKIAEEDFESMFSED